MSAKFHFVKMHGLGNDFIFIKADGQMHNLELSLFFSQDGQKFEISSIVKKIADRRFGIGCDQVIFYAIDNMNIDNNISNYQMAIFNSDGSRAEICGNAARCLAYLVYKETNQKNILISLFGINRILPAKIIDDFNISINMGKAVFNSDWIPAKETLISFLDLYGIESKEVICVDFANPHIVIFSPLSEKDQEIIAKNLQNNSLFPEGININFAKIEKDVINLVVWERGVGFTLACGSGACASFSAAEKLGFVNEKEVIIKFAAGHLLMSKEKNGDVIMIGPASFVAEGEFFL